MTQVIRQADPIKEYYIAYFDLLGYKAFFQHHPERIEDFLQIINDALSNTNDYIQSVGASPVGGGLGDLNIRQKVFSDNVLLCLAKGNTQMEYPRFLAFLSIVADIQRNFILQHGLFLRGGITIGNLSFNDDFVFGQGLIDVVALEDSAIYPRIIMGQPVLDYVLQPHFVKQEDLDRACEIENRAHSGSYITDEEVGFCNSIKPAVDMDRFYLQWRKQLLLSVSDKDVWLNYLYSPDIGDMIGQTTYAQMLEFLRVFSPNDYQRLSSHNYDRKQILEVHKQHIVEKIKEYGHYDDLGTPSDDSIKKASLREHILKKYIWVLMFHNNICMAYKVPECLINFCNVCDFQFMKFGVKILEDNALTAK